jgi:protein-tyrosine phosphatase
MAETTSILFVCLGNICRSPTAQGMFEKQLAASGLVDHVRVDSAGTGEWHVGHPPDPRATEVAAEQGVELGSQRARQVTPADFEAFDRILAMDRANLADLQAMAPEGSRARVELFLSYARHADVDEVPDPYYGGASGFSRVLDLINDASDGLIRDLRSRLVE